MTLFHTGYFNTHMQCKKHYVLYQRTGADRANYGVNWGEIPKSEIKLVIREALRNYTDWTKKWRCYYPLPALGRYWIYCERKPTIDQWQQEISIFTILTILSYCLSSSRFNSIQDGIHIKVAFSGWWWANTNTFICHFRMELKCRKWVLSLYWK